MASITTKNINKLYGDFQALGEINLDIADGEFLTLLGPSGSGKTTLLMTLAGFTQPTGGQVFKNNIDITQMPPEKRNFGMVFQGYALFPHLSVRENIEYPLRVRRISQHKRRQQAETMISIVGLEGHADKKPSQLSGGQQQRVALARSLVFEPDLLLLDEPLSALDRNMREQLQTELKRIHQETKTTFVFVTHDQSEALALSDRIAIFNKGEIIQVDSPTQIYNHPRTRFIAEFLGQINMIPLTNTSVEKNLTRGLFANSELFVPGGEVLSKNQNISIGVRPEYLTLGSQKPGLDLNAVQATITNTTYKGSATDITLLSDNQLEFSISIQNNAADSSPQIGDRAWLSWAIENGKLILD